MDLHFDVLFVTWSHSIRFSSEQKRILRKRVEQARRVMLLYDAQFGTPRQVFLQEVRALISEFGWLRRVRDVCYMLVFPRFDLLSVFFRRRFPLSVGPNIHFICDGTDREKLFADWNPSLKRKFAVFASGAKTSSAWRVELIDCGRLLRGRWWRASMGMVAILRRRSFGRSGARDCHSTNIWKC